MAKRRELLVVDGYNVIRAIPHYRRLVDDTCTIPGMHDVYVRAREALLGDVAAFAHGTYDAVIVFDGFGNPDPDRPPMRLGGVQVVFSPYGVEADSVIEQLVRAERDQDRPVTVVTSDGVVQNTVYGPGVTRLSARMFAAESEVVDKHLAEMSKVPRYPTKTRVTVADRLDPDVRERLRAMTLPKKEREAAQRRHEASRADGLKGRNHDR